MAETIITLIILMVSIGSIIILGIVQYRSKKPPKREQITGYLCMIEGLGGIPAMVAYHNRLNRMYYRKPGDV